ncbi:uncharacterized protein METZ01_LOCUS291305 [marine metagenome]|uniref:Uncharacterized protein n=1 Tax=marine metagenome TaxID=408172 RepID=A0A382LU78_9ZZZZ
MKSEAWVRVQQEIYDNFMTGKDEEIRSLKDEIKTLKASLDSERLSLEIQASEVARIAREQSLVSDLKLCFECKTKIEYQEPEG